MFTPEHRQRTHDALVAMAHDDDRIVAAAAVGGWAEEDHDQWSDIDLNFSVRDEAIVREVLIDWTRRLHEELKAAHLFDLQFQTSIFRVFLFPGNLQVDLSFTPASSFGAYAPRFKLLFGEAVELQYVEPPTAEHLFGLGVHHALRARVCLERGRLWQAEHWITGVREQALALACLKHGLETSEGRGFDQLPRDVLARFDVTFVRQIKRTELSRALGISIDALLREAGGLVAALEPSLRELQR